MFYLLILRHFSNRWHPRLKDKNGKMWHPEYQAERTRLEATLSSLEARISELYNARPQGAEQHTGLLMERRNKERGVGRKLQLAAKDLAGELGCYQIRSRSDYVNAANYHFKIGMGFCIQQSLVDDSVYFIITQ